MKAEFLIYWKIWHIGTHPFPPTQLALIESRKRLTYDIHVSNVINCGRTVTCRWHSMPTHNFSLNFSWTISNSQLSFGACFLFHLFQLEWTLDMTSYCFFFLNRLSGNEVFILSQNIETETPLEKKMQNILAVLIVFRSGCAPFDQFEAILRIACARLSPSLNALLREAKSIKLNDWELHYLAQFEVFGI